MISAVDLLSGQAKIPEGWPAFISQVIATTGPEAIFQVQLEEAYWFYLERIVAKWTATTANSYPAIQIYRDMGQRAYFQEPLDLDLISTPGPLPGGVGGVQKGIALKLGLWFNPSTVLKMKISGYTPSDPAQIKIAAFGRYIHRQDQV